jgi:hypothetical protein
MLAEVLVWYLLLKPDIKGAPDYEMVSGPPFGSQQECEKEIRVMIDGLKTTTLKDPKEWPAGEEFSLYSWNQMRRLASGAPCGQ